MRRSTSGDVRKEITDFVSTVSVVRLCVRFSAIRLMDLTTERGLLVSDNASSQCKVYGNIRAVGVRQRFITMQSLWEHQGCWCQTTLHHNAKFMGTSASLCGLFTFLFSQNYRWRRKRGVRQMRDRQTDRQTGRQADRQTDRQAGWQTGRQADRQAGGQTDRQAVRQIDSPADRQAGRQTDRQRQTGRQRRT